MIRAARVSAKAAALLAVSAYCAAAASLGAFFLARLGGPLRERRALAHRVRMMGLWSRGCLRALSVRVETKGPLPPPALLVSNHLSYLDVLVLGSRAPGIFVSKAQVRRWPFFGWVAAAGGTIFLERGRKRALVGVLASIPKRLEAGLRVALFPEGTTTPGAGILALKPGLLAQAARARLPVYWACLCYRTPEDPALAASRVCWWGNAEFFPHLMGVCALKSVEAKVVFGNAPVASADRKRLAARIREAMLRSFTPTSLSPEPANP